MRKRGISRASMRVRLAVAAAVLAAGGAGAVVAVSASHHSGLANAESAAYSMSNGRTLSYTSALSSAVRGWDQSPGRSLTTISRMKPVTSYWIQSWHRATIVIQRGTVLASGKGRLTVRSADGKVMTWLVNRAAKVLNVGGTATGMSAMTGGSTRVPSWWQMNTKVKGVVKGDLVFVFGERENRTLKAQLVLFAAPAAAMRRMATPMATTPMAIPTTPMATTPMATPTTPMATMTTPAAMPTMTTKAPMPTATVPMATPSATASTFSGTHS